MPYGASVSPDGSKVYVSNEYSGTISVINTVNNMVTATVAVGSKPEGIAVSPDGSRVYITNNGANTVSVINCAVDTILNTIAVGSGPRGITVSPDGNKVYVTNYNASIVSVINTTTNTVTATITVGDYAAGISFCHDGSKVYVAVGGNATVSVINSTTNTVMATIPVGNDPFSFGNFISTCTQPTGITSQSTEQSGSNVYPNPVIKNLTIESPQNAVIEITNIQGQLIKTIVATSNKTVVDVSPFVNGVYVVEVKTEKGIEVRKFVKE
jgi:YVTN family beta-propeller protein